MLTRRPLRTHPTRRWATLACCAGLLAGCGPDEQADPVGPLVDKGGAAGVGGGAGTGGQSAGGSAGVQSGKYKVFINAPDDGALVSGELAVDVSVLPEKDAKGVEFYVGETRVDTDLLPPYTSKIDTKKFPDGPATLKVIAGFSGNKSAETTLKIALDNTGPKVTVTSPKEKQVFYSGALSIKLAVEDQAGVASLKAKVNDLEKDLQGPPYTLDLKLADLKLTEAQLPANLDITLTAKDSLGNASITEHKITLRSRELWSFETNGEVWASVAFGSDGTIYAGSYNKKLYALDPNTGAEKWSAATPGSVIFAPVFDDSSGSGRIWVVSDTELLLFDEAGKAVSTLSAPGGETFSAAPLIDAAAKAIYIPTFNGKLLSFGWDGTTNWTFDTGASIQARPALRNDLIVFGAMDNLVYGVDTAGKKKFEYEAGKPILSQPTFSSTGDFFIGANDGYVYRFNKYGTRLWQFEALGQVWGSATEASDGTLFVGSTYSRVYGLSAEGKELWAYKMGGLSYATPALSADGQQLFVGDNDGQVAALSAKGGLLWSFLTGGSIVSPAILSPDNAMVLVGSYDKKIHALATGLSSCGPPQLVKIGEDWATRYEISRPDATIDSQGTETSKACSRPGVLPWTNVTWAQAKAACETVGLSLCSGKLWQQACNGPDGADFPYGEPINVASCNVNDGSSKSTLQPTGAFPKCASASGVLDASGNAAEWTADDGQGATKIVRGGSYADKGDDVRCSNDQGPAHQLDPASSKPEVGFRCCLITSAP